MQLLQEARPCDHAMLEETARSTAVQGPCPEGRTECFRLTKKSFAKYTIKPDGRSAGPADFQETEDQYREGEGDDPLYSRTATPVDPGLGRHQPYLLGPELLQQPAAPPRDVGHGGRSSGSRRDWYGEAHAPGEVQPTPGVKECVLRATRRDEPDQRAEVVARPLLGGGAPTERLCATPRTDGGDRLPCGGGSIDPAVPCEQEISRASPTGGGAGDP